MSQDPDPVVIGRGGVIVTVTMNHPEVLSALNRQMWQGLLDAFEALELGQNNSTIFNADPSRLAALLVG